MATSTKNKTDPASDSLKNKEEKKEEEEEDVPDLGGSKRLGKEYGRKYLCWCLGGYLFAFLNGCMMPLFAVLFSEILAILGDSVECDEVTGECTSNFAERSLRTLVYFVAMGVGNGVFTVLQYFFWGTYGTKVSIDVRKEYFEAVLKQDIMYHDSQTSSKINSLLTTETASVEAGIGIKMGFAIQQIATFIFGMGFSFYYSWRLTLVLLGTMPVLICIGVIQGKLFANAGKSSDPFVHAGSFSQEVLTNIRTVISIPSLTVSKYNQFTQRVVDGFPIATKRALIAGIGLGFFMFGILAVMYALGLYAGSRFVEADYLSIPDMFGAFFSFMIAGMGLGQMGSVASDIQKATIGANKFYQIKSREPQIKPPDGNMDPIKPSNKLSGALEFKNISFAYSSNLDQEVLTDISFSVLSGETLAIVGPSGSGKSTIISLIERFYDPLKGDIILDNNSKNKIHNYDINYLRSQIGLVSQMPLLFDCSIEENIRGGNKTASDDDIVEAAQAANAHDFVLKLPKGYKTMVGELGGRLSGGQRQRIAIARAMLGKPSILLLDEATSALDSKSEKEVQEAIDKISSTRNQTVIAIAHRLSTIKNADNIIVLVDGGIRESGNHKELMNHNGIYSALVKAQALVEEKKQIHQKQRSMSMDNIAKQLNNELNDD